MKGTFFQKPLEFRLNVDGESWNQGDQLSCELILKNHGAETALGDESHLSLVYGRMKKIRAKEVDSFDVLASAKIEATSIAAGAETKLATKFTLDRNAQVTDNVGSIFLIYGAGPIEQRGQLQLSVKPALVIQELVRVFQENFRFVVKSVRASQGGVDVKMAPPSGPSFASTEELSAWFQLKADLTLDIELGFQVKKVEPTPGSAAVKKEKREFEISLTQAEYLTSAGRWNRDFLEEQIKSVISQVESKLSF